MVMANMLVDSALGNENISLIDGHS